MLPGRFGGDRPNVDGLKPIWPQEFKVDAEAEDRLQLLLAIA